MSADLLSITLNGEPRELPDSVRTVAALLAHLEIPQAERGVAVALDGAVVPRSQWESTTLHAQAELEIIRATQGG